MRTKTILENTDELLHAAQNARISGDDFPYITGKLIWEEHTVRLEDPNIEWEGDPAELIKALCKKANLEVHLT